MRCRARRSTPRFARAGWSPVPEPGDVARGLFENARGDAATARIIADADGPDRMVGFHVQQAVEMFLEAVLAWCGVAYERTHDIERLVELVVGAGMAPPADRDELAQLTPWAVELRYGDPFDPEPIDRTWALGVVDRVERWAETLLRQGDGGAPLRTWRPWASEGDHAGKGRAG